MKLTSPLRVRDDAASNRDDIRQEGEGRGHGARGDTAEAESSGRLVRAGGTFRNGTEAVTTLGQSTSNKVGERLSGAVV